MATIQDKLDAIEAGADYVDDSLMLGDSDNSFAKYSWLEDGPNGEAISKEVFYTYTWDDTKAREAQTVVVETNVATVVIGEGEDEVITALAIRDTTAHISSVSDNRGAIPKTIVIYNDTDENFTIQLQGDRDSAFDMAMNIGSSFVVVAGTHDYATITDYLPYLRVSVIAGTAPTTGDLSVYILRVKH